MEEKLRWSVIVCQCMGPLERLSIWYTLRECPPKVWQKCVDERPVRRFRLFVSEEDFRICSKANRILYATIHPSMVH